MDKPKPQIEIKKYNSYQDFYNDIPVEGSLGILALGAYGIIAWRKKREEHKNSAPGGEKAE